MSPIDEYVFEKITKVFRRKGNKLLKTFEIMFDKDTASTVVWYIRVILLLYNFYSLMFIKKYIYLHSILGLINIIDVIVTM